MTICENCLILYNKRYSYVKIILQVRFLAAKGGKSTKDSVKSMFSCLFSNDLTKLCNWTGLGQKISFKGLILKNIVHNKFENSSLLLVYFLSYFQQFSKRQYCRIQNKVCCHCRK